MALILTGGGITAIRGKVGGHVFSRAKSGAIMKSRTTGVNPRTSAQTFARAQLATQSKNWSNNLSLSDQNSWNALALVNPSTNVFGQTLYLSGQQLFVQCNCNLALALVPSLTTAPPDLNVLPYTSASVAVSSAAGGTITFTLGVPAVVGTPLGIAYAAAPQREGPRI